MLKRKPWQDTWCVKLRNENHDRTNGVWNSAPSYICWVQQICPEIVRTVARLRNSDNLKIWIMHGKGVCLKCLSSPSSVCYYNCRFNFHSNSELKNFITDNIKILDFWIVRWPRLMKMLIFIGDISDTHFFVCLKCLHQPILNVNYKYNSNPNYNYNIKYNNKRPRGVVKSPTEGRQAIP